MLNFVVPLVSLLIIILVIFLYIYPSTKKLPLKKEELAQKTTVKQTLTTKVASLNRLVDFQNILDENLEIVNKVLVPEAEVPRLLDQVTQVSDKAGMVLDRLSYSYGGSGGEFFSSTRSLLSLFVLIFNYIVIYSFLIQEIYRKRRKK